MRQLPQLAARPGEYTLQVQRPLRLRQELIIHRHVALFGRYACLGGLLERGGSLSFSRVRILRHR